MANAEQKREQRRRQILQAAKEVFAEKGFHVASISDVIKKAGIARGTFYLYFNSKEAVFESILDLTIQELEARIIGVELGADAKPPGVQLHENVARVLQFMLADRALIQILLNHGLPPDAELAHKVDGFFGHVEERIESSLTQGMAIGLVRPCDSALTAAQILGALRGGIRRLTRVQDEFDVKAIASQFIEFATKGVIVDGVTIPS